MKTKDFNHTIVGIVLYNPELDILSRCVNSLKQNFSHFVFFCNSDINFNLHTLFDDNRFDISIIGNCKNSGIAKAHNEILKFAVLQNYRYLLLSDQDTFYPLGLSDYYVPFKDNNVVAVCPSWSDIKFSSDIFQSLIYSDLSFKINVASSRFNSVSHAISSGLMIKLCFKKKIIMFNEKLFIDFVDNEWCWNVIDQGFSIISANKIFLTHNMADSVFKIFHFKLLKRTKVRNYYILRNSLHLILYSNFSFFIKQFLLKKFFLHLLYCLLHTRSYLRLTIYSMFDACFNNMYKCKHEFKN